MGKNGNSGEKAFSMAFYVLWEGKIRVMLWVQFRTKMKEGGGEINT